MCGMHSNGNCRMQEAQELQQKAEQTAFDLAQENNELRAEVTPPPWA